MIPYKVLGVFLVTSLVFPSFSCINIVPFHDDSPDDSLDIIPNFPAPSESLISPFTDRLDSVSGDSISSAKHKIVKRVKREEKHSALYEKIISYLRSELNAFRSRALTLFSSPAQRKNKLPEIDDSSKAFSTKSAPKNAYAKSIIKEKKFPTTSSATVSFAKNSILHKEKFSTRNLVKILNLLSDDRVCGRQLLKRRHSVWRRVTGGDKATFGEWPWQVRQGTCRSKDKVIILHKLSLRLKVGSRSQHQCGAALLSHRWGVTAAHCVYKFPKRYLTVRAGEYDFSSTKEMLPHFDEEIEDVVIHPQFDISTLQNDIALLYLKNPIQYQEHILPVCLPPVNDFFDNETAYATGWGRLYEDGPVSNVLRKIKVPILDNRECAWMIRRNFLRATIPNVFLCAGRSEGGVDACEGDSGGPLVVQQRNDRWILVGLTSSGRGPGCGRPNRPGFYTRVSEYSHWVQAIMNEW